MLFEKKSFNRFCLKLPISLILLDILLDVFLIELIELYTRMLSSVKIKDFF